MAYPCPLSLRARHVSTMTSDAAGDVAQAAICKAIGKLHTYPR